MPPISQADAPEWMTLHALTAEDALFMSVLRAAVEPMKGRMQGAAARAPFDSIMERAAASPDVSYEEDIVGGVSGWWCRPPDARSGQAILHLHGGWFNWGSARAFRNFIGQIARRTGVDTFIPDYRLAPEYPFPAAVHDVRDCYLGLLERGVERVAVTGDSAGGCLALVLLALTSGSHAIARIAPVAAAVLSPVTDLSLSGASWETRLDADPYFTRSQVAQLVAAYLQGQDPGTAGASPLWGNLAGLPPIRVHVGSEELLLDDSRRYVEKAVAANVDARLDIWEGVAHGFASAANRLCAGDAALNSICAFITDRLTDAGGN